jgi:hypothetical protein
VKEALEEIEAKELSRQGRGEEVAKSRFVDSVEMAPMTAADREAAKSIRAAGRRKKIKKKDTAFYRKGWFVTVGAVLILAGMSFVVWWLLRPDSPAEMLARVRNAKNSAARIEAAKKYLAAYGDKNDPELVKNTAWVRQAFWDAQVEDREKVLLNRHGKQILRNRVEEGDDANAYQQTMNAFTAEEDGDVRRAKEIWKALVDEYQPNPDEKLALWGHIAAKRLIDLKQVDENLKKIRSLIETAEANETTVRVDDELLARAALAERYRGLGDEDRARDRWERMARDLKDKPESRGWYLLASQRTRDLPARRLSPEDRRRFIVEKLNRAEAELAKATDNNDRVGVRDARQLGREIADLYAGDDAYKEELRRARALAGSP